MPKGISLHLGLNTIDPNHYGEDGQLYGCENDAKAMQAIAKAKGFSSTLLLTEEATTRNVIAAIKHAVNQLKAGDIFLLSYSGHGAQIWDKSVDEPTKEGVSYQGQDPKTKIDLFWSEGPKDETLCLYDRMYWDDELFAQLAHFAEGVRILYIADCCHAESNYKALETTMPPARGLGLDKAMQITQLNQTDYDEAWYKNRDFVKANNKLKASLIQLAACQDTQLSGDAYPDDPHPSGVFTKRLLQVWNNGHFNGTYQQLLNQITQLIPQNWDQTPQYLLEGASNPIFEQQKPFTI
ncbi:MAG: caspase family protein [Thiofilum sp.]|uniref:caspase family protein n=1 Tax=Thiofilum sp. TaxID=2212733 RepID=UPI0025F5764A|nr:caspase family protein [Thiofilum sp.]MBK8453507.1 caspase family protein [Thiofilum sp.]